jgi:hypothetical protein
MGCLEPHATRRPRIFPAREILDTILYVLSGNLGTEISCSSYGSWRWVVAALGAVTAHVPYDL